MTEASQSAASLQSAPPLAPKARLDASRAALRLAMLPEVPAAVNTSQRPGGESLLSSPINALRRNPLVSTVLDTARQWWATRSWRPIVSVGIEAASQMVVPMARRYPGRVVAIVMVGGALLSRWRTWKWIVVTTVPALAASLVPTLISRLASRLPLSTLLNLAGLSSTTAPRSRRENALPTTAKD